MNNNITEDYCSFEVSKLLKEKGFDCQCDMLHIEKEKHPILGSLFKDGNDLEIVTNSQFEEYKVEYGFDGYLKGKEILTIPTHALAIKWLLVNHKVAIDVVLRSSEPSWLAVIVNNYSITHKGSGNFDYFTNETRLTNEFKGWKTPEEATETALLYTLKHLI